MWKRKNFLAWIYPNDSKHLLLSDWRLAPGVWSGQGTEWEMEVQDRKK